MRLKQYIYVLNNLINAANIFYKLAGESRTLYHISQHGPAKPVPKIYGWPSRNWEEGKEIARTKKEIKEFKKQEPRAGWIRPWLKEPVYSGVFLTNSPVAVWASHGKKGAVHVYKVKENIIKDSGGLHRFDWAPEILISENLWNEGISNGDIKYIGFISSDKFKDIVKEKHVYSLPYKENKAWPSKEEAAKEVAETNEAAKAYLDLIPKIRELRLKNKISIKEAIDITEGLIEFFYSYYNPPINEIPEDKKEKAHLAIKIALEKLKLYIEMAK